MKGETKGVAEVGAGLTLSAIRGQAAVALETIPSSSSHSSLGFHWEMTLLLSQS